jgi:hypothetical protein
MSFQSWNMSMDQFESMHHILKLLTYHDGSALNLEVVCQLTTHAAQLLTWADRQYPRGNTQQRLQTEAHFCRTYPLAWTHKWWWLVTNGNKTLLSFTVCWDCIFCVALPPKKITAQLMKVSSRCVSMMCTLFLKTEYTLSLTLIFITNLTNCNTFFT